MKAGWQRWQRQWEVAAPVWAQPAVGRVRLQDRVGRQRVQPERPWSQEAAGAVAGEAASAIATGAARRVDAPVPAHASSRGREGSDVPQGLA